MANHGCAFSKHRDAAVERPQIHPIIPGTRDWLIANNGDAVPATVVDEIADAGGPARSDGWWAAHDGSTDAYLPDAATDWIEEIANDETPPAGQ